jgi:choline-glycine betaine transporter
MKKLSLKGLRPLVFFPAFGLILATILFSFLNYDTFLQYTTLARDFMTVQSGWIFSLVGVASLIVIILIYFSPLGNVRIGGENAKPLLNRISWFTITLCTTIAAGIMFWGTAEPIYHLAYPPASLGIEPMSAEAAKFAMETLFLHWTFVPYAIYAVPTIMFAFAYYNMKKSFSVGSQIAPLTGKIKVSKLNMLIDAIVIFTVAAGIAASFGTSILNMGGGINSLFGLENNVSLWVILTIMGTLAFIASSASGLFRGIKWLSNFNFSLYVLILLVLVIFGPTVYMFGLGTEALGGFITNIFDKALFTGAAAGDTWASGWTIFYWSNWMAWAPVSAVFLGRLTYGYKVKEAVTMNFIIPSIFSAIWMTILGGTAINYQMNGTLDLLKIMNENGSAAAGFAILRTMPFSNLIIGVYLIAIFTSFITATDSTTNAMASISTTGILDGKKEAPLLIKVIWGSLVGLMALLFISTLGLDGIRMLSYLGGYPALFLLILTIIALFYVMLNPLKYNLVNIKKRK